MSCMYKRCWINQVSFIVQVCVCPHQELLKGTGTGQGSGFYLLLNLLELVSWCYQIAYTLRSAVFHKMMRLSPAAMLEHSSGKIVNLVSNDINSIAFNVPGIGASLSLSYSCVVRDEGPGLTCEWETLNCRKRRLHLSPARVLRAEVWVVRIAWALLDTVSNFVLLPFFLYRLVGVAFLYAFSMWIILAPASAYVGHCVLHAVKAKMARCAATYPLGMVEKRLK
jgi:ABC-type multidrug transport system fused ATPase/permease subunit